MDNIQYIYTVTVKEVTRFFWQFVLCINSRTAQAFFILISGYFTGPKYFTGFSGQNTLTYFVYAIDFWLFKFFSPLKRHPFSVTCELCKYCHPNLSLDQTILHCTNTPNFIYSPIDGHLGCFRLSGMVTNPAMMMSVQISA